MKKIAILGSCMTRELFNSKFVVNHADHFQVAFTLYQNSLISNLSSFKAYDKASLTPLTGHDLQVTTDDFDKQFEILLAKHKPHYILVDLFADTRFGCVAHGESYITRNDWKLCNTALYKTQLKPEKHIHLNMNKQEYLAVFKEKIAQLKQFIANHHPSCQILLNEAKLISHYKNNDNEMKSFNVQDNEKFNANWAILNDVFKQETQCQTLNGLDEDSLADFNHYAGLAPFHYEKSYHQKVFAQLLKVQ